MCVHVFFLKEYPQFFSDSKLNLCCPIFLLPVQSIDLPATTQRSRITGLAILGYTWMFLEGRRKIPVFYQIEEWLIPKVFFLFFCFFKKLDMRKAFKCFEAWYIFIYSIFWCLWDKWTRYYHFHYPELRTREVRAQWFLTWIGHHLGALKNMIPQPLNILIQLIWSAVWVSTYCKRFSRGFWRAAQFGNHCVGSIALGMEFVFDVGMRLS